MDKNITKKTITTIIILILTLTITTAQEETLTATTKTTCNNQGTCNLMIYSTVMHYWNGTHHNKVNNTIKETNDTQYKYKSTGIQTIQYKEDPTTAETIRYEYNETAIEGANPHKQGYLTIQPHTLQYSNDLDQIQQINIPQHDNTTTKENKITYRNIYGNGTFLTFTTNNDNLQKELKIENNQTLTQPEQYIINGGNPTIDYIMQIQWKEQIDIYINNTKWDKQTTTTTKNKIEFRLNNETIWYLKEPKATDKNESQTRLTYTLKKQGTKLYLTIKTNYTWTKNATYPIIIDPNIELKLATNQEHMLDTSNREEESPPNRDVNHGTCTYWYHLKAILSWNEVITRWNITSIPEDVTITDATLHGLIRTNNLDSGEAINITPWRVQYGYGKTEGTKCGASETDPAITFDTYENSIKYNASPVTTITNGQSGWVTFDVTLGVRDAYMTGQSNVSILLNGTAYTGAPSTSDFVLTESKEHATPSSRPILNITYSTTDNIAPFDPIVNINTSPTNNNGSKEQLNCYFTTNDREGDNMNVTTNWYNESILYSTNITRGVANNTEYNYSLAPNEIILEFYQDNTLTNTDGYIADTDSPPKIFTFNGTSVVIVQQNLSEGRINIRLNNISANNWSQYYEYINDETTHINEDIEIIKTADISAHIEVLDYENAPIEDATIRAEYTYKQINNWTYGTLLGQRLTEDDGITFFIGDSSSEVLLTITKDGYQPDEKLYTIGDTVTYTRTDPLTIYLKESESGVLENAWIYIRNYFTNRTLDQTGLIVAKGRELVEVQTLYRTTQGLSRKDITNAGDAHDRYLFTLKSGTDFNDEGTSNIELLIYLDNTLWRNLTINYDQAEKTSVFTIPNISGTILTVILALSLILISYGSRFIINNENVGKNVYMTGAIFMGIISIQFAWLSLICLFYYIALYLKKIVIHD